MNKTFSCLFLKNAWKPLNFIQIIAPEKVCPSVKQNEIDKYRVSIKDGKYTWKWTCSTHGLYVFWKENHPNLCAFSIKLTFLQFYLNFITSSYSINPSTDLAQFHGTVCFFRLFYSFHNFLDFQLFRPKYHWRDLISRNAHLVHQNWYRISFTQNSF
jgi:hypothetical protein